MERNDAVAEDGAERNLEDESQVDDSSSVDRNVDADGRQQGELVEFEFDVAPTPTASKVEVTVNVSDFEPGLRALEAVGQQGAHDIYRVTLQDMPVYRYNDNAADPRIETQHAIRRSFGRFVTLFDRYGREGVRSVTFYNIRSDGPDWMFEEADQARLFGEVLPSLPFLEKVHLFYASLPIAHLKTFASRVSATSSFVELDIDNCPGDFLACAPDLADMVRRNVRIQVLKLNASKGLDRDACRQIFDSLQNNTNLRSLEVKVEEVYADALTLPTNKASSLRRLRIDVETWTREGKASLAQQLKANTLLEALQIVHRNAIRLTHRPWVEMLKPHNFTLRSLREHSLGRYGVHAAQMGDIIPRYLSRNESIHQALDDLQGYHVSPAVLWPHVLGMVSDVPTLIYRFVRLGDINALVDLLVANHSSNKRGRPPTPPRRPRRSRRVATLRK